MTLLLFTPTFGDGPMPEMMGSVSQQTYVDYVHEVSYHNPYPGQKMRNVLAQYQRGQQLCLAGDYEAMLTVEHDMVIPPNAIEKLLDTDADVVFGTYMLRHGTPCLNAWQYVNDNNLGMSLSLYPKELRRLQAKGQGRVSGVGWGCTLIRRNVLEKIAIRAAGDSDAGDMGFATDCLRAGVKMIARFDVRCGHYHESGELLEIGGGLGIVNRVLALQTFNARVNDASMPMKKDRYYSLPPDVAASLQRAGYVKITNTDDENLEVGEVEQPDITKREMAVNPKAATRGKRKK